jgi:hypothetical protein
MWRLLVTLIAKSNPTLSPYQTGANGSPLDTRMSVPHLEYRLLWQLVSAMSLTKQMRPAPASDMEEQAQRFFGRKQLGVAHSIVTDVGAFGVGQEVVREYPFGTQLHRDKCMMHQMGKVQITYTCYYYFHTRSTTSN